MEIRLKELLDLLRPRQSNCLDDFTIKGFSIDSRDIKKGEVFIGIKGKNFDGNDFAMDAFRRGAPCVIVDRRVNCPHILVDDTLSVLKSIASYNLRRSKAKSVAVVGSVGKTTAKELLAGFLECKAKVCKTYQNQNNVIGVCKTLLRLKDEEFCVVEVGVNKKGEMDEIAAFFKPDAVLFLNVGRVHLEFFDSVDEVFRQKSKIITDDSILIYNGDDSILRDNFRNRGNSFCFSVNGNCPFKAIVETSKIIVSGAEETFEVKIKDGINPYTVLGSISAAIVFGNEVDQQCINQALDNFMPIGYRMKKEKVGHTTFILDCYNANVDSMKFAIENLSAHRGKKLAVLSDMLELGNYSEQLHREIGMFLSGFDVDLLTFGKDAFFIYDEFVKSGKGFAKFFSGKVEIIEFLKKRYAMYDVVLLKGSRGMKLEELFFALRGER